MVRDVSLRKADMADRLDLRAGDRVLAVETDKEILLTPYDPTTSEALALAARQPAGTGTP